MSYDGNNSKAFWTSVSRAYKKDMARGQKLIHHLPSNPYAIKFVKDPTKEEQLAAVCSEARVMRYIKDPDDYVAIRAIKIHGYLIKYIKNPTDEMWHHALTNEPRQVFQHPNPTWEMFNIVKDKVKGLNKHKGLLPEMHVYLSLVA